jgi:hypothetical protein
MRHFTLPRDLALALIERILEHPTVVLADDVAEPHEYRLFYRLDDGRYLLAVVKHTSRRLLREYVSDGEEDQVVSPAFSEDPAMKKPRIVFRHFAGSGPLSIYWYDGPYGDAVEVINRPARPDRTPGASAGPRSIRDGRHQAQRWRTRLGCWSRARRRSRWARPALYVTYDPNGLQQMVSRASARSDGAVVFAYRVKDPDRYGVIEFDADGKPSAIVEKPPQPRSNYAVTGLYFYDNSVLDIARSVKPSARGELEITDVNRVYLEQGRLACERMSRGYAWLDAGTPDSLLEAAQFVQTIESRQGTRIACLEEIAYRQGFITLDRLSELARANGKSDYARYLLSVVEESKAGA